ncbi:MAG TPA: hypothetical protein VMJ75_04770 [Candidatus Acidoferrales bacterium]|nr:hypothetical protein [Candidatus Acidoferrales bacterium]
MARNRNDARKTPPQSTPAGSCELLFPAPEGFTGYDGEMGFTSGAGASAEGKIGACVVLVLGADTASPEGNELVTSALLG